MPTMNKNRKLVKTIRVKKNGVVVKTKRIYKVTKTKPKPKKLSELRYGIDRHPQTGKLIPHPSDRYAAYPGPGFTRKVKVTRRNGRIVSRVPVSGWRPKKGL